MLLPNISKSDSKYQRRKKKKYFCRYFFTSQYLISRTKKGRKMRWSEIIRSNKKPSCRCPLKFFLNGPSSASFSFIFSVFLATNTYFTTNLCEKCPSSIRCQDLNSQPSEQESLPITTSTRAPALGAFLCK